MLMPTEEQLHLRRTARDFLARSWPAERLGALLDDHDAPDGSMWERIGRLGWPAITIDSDLGGAGMDQADLIVVAEETAGAMLRSPLFTTAGLAAPLLQAAGATKLLREIANDGLTVTIAWADPSGGAALADLPTTTSTCVDDHNRITGAKAWVPDAGHAGTFLLPALGDSGVGLWSVPSDRPGVTLTRQSHMDLSRPCYLVEFDGAQASQVSDAATFPRVWRHAYPRMQLWTAAEATGICDRMLAVAVEHARTRMQFGRAIGSFQAVSHALADVYVDLEMARSTVAWAAHELDTDGAQGALSADCSVAIALPAAVHACEVAIQVLGGVGMTWDSAVHRYYKRALGLSALHGTSGLAHERIAAAVLGGGFESLG